MKTSCARSPEARADRAMDRNGLADIYRRLDALETRKVGTVTFRPKIEIYWIPLAAAVLLSMALEALSALVGWLRERAARRSAAPEPLQRAMIDALHAFHFLRPGGSSRSRRPSSSGSSSGGRATRPRAGAASSIRRF